MIRNYFKTAWRNLNKHRVFSLINILGLAIGIAAFCILALYVTDELSYDRYNTKADRIFRVVQHGAWNGGKFDLAPTSAPYAAALKNDYAEVEDAVRINGEGNGKIVYGDKQLTVNNMVFADASLFNIFSYQFISGNAASALTKPQSIVLSRTLASSIFGDFKNAYGKTLIIDGNQTQVTAVIEDIPANSHLTFAAIRSFGTHYDEPWGNSDLSTYVLLKHPDDYKRIENSSEAFYQKYLKGVFGNMKFRLELQPVTSIHLHSHLSYDTPGNGNASYVYVFSLIGILVLGIAIINYVNLATARSATRVKEIGLRKVIGSDRKQLMLQFFAESILLNLIAALIAYVIIYASLPYFNNLSGKHLDLWHFGMTQTLILFTAFIIVSGLLSGIYPALFLSGFKTIPALKGQMGNQAGTVFFRKSLVVFQFVITIVMITGLCVIYSQLKYVINKDLGFNKQQVLTFHIHDQDARAKAATIKAQLMENPAVQAVAVAGNPIGSYDLSSGDFALDLNGKAGPETKIVQNLVIDQDFIPTMQIKLLQGRNFDLKQLTDKTDAIIVNETLVKEMGWQNAIGRKVRTGVDGKGNVISQTIIGVVKDFNTNSLQHKIAPVVMGMPQQAKDGDNFYVRIAKANILQTLNYIARVYGGYDNEKIDFQFLDQNFNSQYQSERKQGSLLFIFSALAISIACLGLFGLVTFTAQQRNKEIGIRKVLGASVSNIVNMLSKDLMKLVIIATIIAVPIAWWAMGMWLNNFAYRIHMNAWMFIAASLIALIIAFATISFQSIKAAFANPVKSLRNE
ncbi:ABC transporter permease [Mucilaginibacter sp. KACC 22063]|uniref:ABC transporter permease n=1 Tax=Mucilaginibacter sp. KACC 22063 TaxID=3025666 RepID=UPI0023671309|nr:ABC transporter permease [Mucilaginibacter sp. KACC 22063]WDF56773.1 ABC transporter permease [Mucilaginibacter sp. KACC 22063]